MCWVGTRRNDFFLFFFVFFLSFTAIPNLFWLGKKQQWCFLIFLNFFATFFEFSITGWVGTHWNDFFCFFFSLFLGLPQLILAWKDATMVFFNFFEFFGIFFEFSITGQVGTHWNDFFFLSLTQPFPTYFLSFSTFPNIFCLEKKP